MNLKPASPAPEETSEALELCGAQRSDEPEPCRNLLGECHLHCSGRTKAGERCPRRPLREDPEGRCSVHTSGYNLPARRSAGKAGPTYLNVLTVTSELEALRKQFKKLEREGRQPQELRRLAEQIRKLVTSEAHIRITLGQTIGTEELLHLIDEFCVVIRESTPPDTADFIIERFAQIFEQYAQSVVQESEEG